MNRKIRLVIDLDVDTYLMHAFSLDESERDWFRNHVLGDDLLLHSNLIGDTIGSVSVVNIIEKDSPEPDYRSDEVKWIKWYRSLTKCGLKEAVEKGRELYG